MSHPAPEVITTRERLVSLLFETSRNTKLVSVNGTVGYVSAIEREDGSGYCFNVTLYTYGVIDGMMNPSLSKKEKVFIRFN